MGGQDSPNAKARRRGHDLVAEGKATKVSDEARLQQIADAYAVQGWHPTVRNGVFYADYGAPSAGPSPYEVYEVIPVTIFGLGTDEPYGATRWRFWLVAKRCAFRQADVCPLWACAYYLEMLQAKQKRKEEPMVEIEDTGALQSEQQRVADWDHLTELRQQLYGAATRQMLAAADLHLGDQVLDIAAGTGDQSRQAAHLVRSEGSVLVTDISPLLKC